MLTEKHNQEIIKKTFYCTLLLYAVICLYCLVAALVVKYKVPIVLTVLALTLINNFIIFIASRKASYSIYKHLLIICVGIEFPLVVFGSFATFMPMIAFPIAVIVVMFNDSKLAWRSVAYAIAVNLLFTFIKMDSEHQLQLFVQSAIIIIFSIMLVTYSSMVNKHALEDVALTQEASEKVHNVNQKILELTTELSDSFKEANDQMENLTTYSSTSDKAVTEIMSATKSTAEMTEQQAMDVADIDNNIIRIKENTESVLTLSSETKSSIQTGVKSILELEKKGQEIMQINQQTKESNERLNAGVEDVKNITSTILGIAGQTNLLALNASIEAARAGEHGKGFAVVADEIRALSDGTKKAAEQITEIIQNLVDNAEQSSEDINISLENTNIQNELVKETKSQLSLINDNMENLGENISEIAEMIGSIVQLSAHISDNVTNLSAVSQEIAASSENTSSVSSKSLSAVNKVNDELLKINSIAENIQSTIES